MYVYTWTYMHVLFFSKLTYSYFFHKEKEMNVYMSVNLFSNLTNKRLQTLAFHLKNCINHLATQIRKFP